MNKKDVLELRRRFKKESCTISRMAGCYVDGYKNKVLKFNENFLNLPEDEFYKFLEIAKKTMGGTIGNNILELDFPIEEESGGGRQQFFMGLRESKLNNEDLLDRLYDMIIENYEHTGNFLILIYNDSYDIISRTSDNLKLDESEEVYEYLLVSVCPVELSKAGLGYRADENRIGSRVRDWVVGAPEMGILFPAFDDHSANIHSVDYFLKDPKDSHAEFVETVLGCGAKRTATEQKKTFAAIVKRAYNNNEDKAEEVLMDIQESMQLRVEAFTEEGVTAPDVESIVLNDRVISEILEENKVETGSAKMIKEICKEEFADEEPMIENLIDHKALEKNMQIKKERELVKEVASLKEKLENAQINPTATDIILSVDPERAEQILSRVIDNQRYVMIPIEDSDTLTINGSEADI